MKAIILALALAVAVPAVAGPAAAAQSCCKICRTGKACGNSCISAKRTCHQAKGCACNG